MMEILVALSVWFLVCCLGARIAEGKGWRWSTGFVLVVLFGPFGLLVCALFPTTEARREQMKLCAKQFDHDKPGTHET